MVNETTSVELLNIVLQYGSQRYRHGLAAGVLGLDTQGHGTAADALLARIAALVPQQPVQARDEFGTIWQHSCGMTGYGPGGSCPGNCGELGPWRPLFDAPGGAPASAHEQPDLIAQVMAGLVVDRPEDVLDAVKDLLADDTADYASRLKATNRSWTEVARERDEARAEVERLRKELEEDHVCTAACRPNAHVAFVGRRELDDARGSLLKVVAQRDKARAQLNEEIAQADEHAAWADRLAQAAIKRHGVRLTEEGGHEVWEAALAALTAQPDPLVLRLPEVP